MNEKITINTDEHQKELIIREGTALELLQPVKIRESGNIQAPGKFHKLRPGDPVKSLVTYNRSKMEIIFKANPEDSLAAEITGKLELTSDLKKFEINTAKIWQLVELSKFLKMNKVFFAEPDKAEELLVALMAFRATVTTDNERTHDNRGNAKALTERKTTSNVPLDFKLDMPIFVGEPNKIFRVDIGVDATDAGIQFWLESSELQLLIITLRDELIHQQIKQFAGLIIIEQ